MIKKFYRYFLTRMNIVTVKNTIAEGEYYKKTVLKDTDLTATDAFLSTELKYYTERLNNLADEINSKMPSFLHVKKEGNCTTK